MKGFLAIARSIVSTLMLGCLAVAATAQQPQVKTDLPYRVIEPALPPLSGALGDSARDRIEVIQFFYYGCPHCFDMQPILDDWLAKKPADVEFRYVPALRDDKWLVLTRAAFALEILGADRRLRRPIYDVINFDGAVLTDPAKFADWAARNGVDRARFMAVYESAEVTTRVEAARKATNDYGVRATPTFVVAGKYSFSSGQAGSHYEAIRLLNQFVDLARRERK